MDARSYLLSLPPEESTFPGLPYVIFAGNVGGPDSLARVIEILRGD